MKAGLSRSSIPQLIRLIIYGPGRKSRLLKAARELQALMTHRSLMVWQIPEAGDAAQRVGRNHKFSIVLAVQLLVRNEQKYQLLGKFSADPSVLQPLPLAHQRGNQSFSQKQHFGAGILLSDSFGEMHFFPLILGSSPQAIVLTALFAVSGAYNGNFLVVCVALRHKINHAFTLDVKEGKKEVLFLIS